MIILTAATRLASSCLHAEEAVSESARADVSPIVLTTLDQIWQAEQHQWYRVRLKYVVYYYDPLWLALWGRCGEAHSFISLGAKTFPIKAGQTVLIEGLIQPARGMKLDEPKVTVLSETTVLDAASTDGKVGDSELFDQRLVTMKGYVEQQTVQDANHLGLQMIAEGKSVLVHVLLKSGEPLPQFKDAFVTVKGVYLPRRDPEWIGPKIEVWAQNLEDVKLTGSLERDERFNTLPTPLDQLAKVSPNELVHVIGTAQEQQIGKSLTIREGTSDLALRSPQTLSMQTGERVEAIGYLWLDGKVWRLNQALFRPAQTVITTLSQIWNLSGAEKQKWHHVQLDCVVYYYDPFWKALWVRTGGTGEYLSLGDKKFPIKPGQRILVEGWVLPADTIVVEEPKVTVLEESVPLDILPTRGRIAEADKLNKHMVVVEGYVDRQETRNGGHLDLDLIVEGRVVTCRLLLGPGEPVPAWEGALLRIKGLYSATLDPTAGRLNLELWTQGRNNVEVIGSLEQDEQFNIPATPIEHVSMAMKDKLVRVVGVARSQQRGKSVTIRDETGQLDVRSVQTQPVRLGEMVEAIGYPVIEGTVLNLRDGLYRKSHVAPMAPTSGLAKLRLADQLRELQPEEAARSYPVQLSGVVTWARPNADFFFMRDVSGGVCVFRPPGLAASMYVGTKVEVTGVSARGKFTPVVFASTVQTFSTIEMPEPPTITLEQALTGIEEAEWVSMIGYVRAVVPDGPWARFELVTSAGEFQAMVPPSERWAKLPGSVVRMRGVCTAVANNKRQLTGIQLWVPTERVVDIEEAAPEDPFAIPMRSIASLRQFSSRKVSNRLVRVSGVVIHQAAGRLVHIQDGTEGLLVLSRDTTPLAPGDRIETVGYPGRENNRVVLREAVYRKIASAAEPTPLVVHTLASIDPELDGRLVRVHALLLDIGAHENGVRLINQQDQMIFEALLDAPRSAVPADWVPRSQVELTGVYQIQFDEYRRPHAVTIQLRSPRDVTVVQRASWWTVRRALMATGILAVGVVLGFGWVVALRRRVRQQTGVIREQLENEKAARLEAALARASKLESLGVLAGGIAHDFNNLLTVVMGNLSLARLDPHIEEDTVHCIKESERAATRARDLTQQLLTFAKGGEPMRVSTRLPDTIREAAQFALHGSKVRCEFEFAPDLWLANVDKAQIGQVVHNIVINANQAMSGGGLLQVVLSNETLAKPRGGLPPGNYVKMSFTDTGSGISPEHVARVFEPYFTTKPHGSGLGLATVYSIVKKHEGHIAVTSKVGQGTTFTIWLPSAPDSAVRAANEPRAKPVGSARVLFMDDEATIRKLGTTVLKRMGLEVTAVNDGAAVVTEYASATAAGRPYDLVIMDLTVPGGMGGGEAMQRLRAIDSNVRAIVSSGYSSDPVMANYQSHGFQARVPKPYLAGDLITAVNTILGRSS